MAHLSFVARDITDAAKASTQCAIVPLFQGEKLSGIALHLDRASGGVIKAALDLGDFTAKPGTSLLLHGTGASTHSTPIPPARSAMSRVASGDIVE